MKAIIPVAGKGTRLRPLTLTTPKAMLEVAGKPIIDHIVDNLLPLEPTELVFVTGYLREQIEEHLHEKYDDSVKITCVQQSQLRGTADAVWTGKDAMDEDVIIDFGDTIFDADISIIKDCDSDGIIWVQEVDDPTRFGVVIEEDGYMTQIVEKPKMFVSNLANIGLYYIKNTELLKEAIQHTIDNHTGDSEIYLTEALQYMIEKGARIRVARAQGWWDCGTQEELEATDAALRAKTS